MEERQQELSCKNLIEVVKSSERRLQPKVLTDSAMHEPTFSDVIDKNVSLVDAKKKPEPRVDETLELSQSIFISHSQFRDITDTVTYP